MSGPTTSNLTAYAPADQLAKQAIRRAQNKLNELREVYPDLTYAERFVVKEEIRLLAYLLEGDPLCALCAHPFGSHTHDGHWCPNAAGDDHAQKFTRGL